MREILFRGKRLDNGEWVYGFLLIDGITGRYFIHMSGNCLNESDKAGQEGCLMFVAFEVDPETVCQYTGLTDKNGKKIFEGDIVSYEDETPGQYEYHDSTFINRGKIVYSDGSFGVTDAIAATMDDLLMGNGVVDCEVIGNIFDNPDLLHTSSTDSD